MTLSLILGMKYQQGWVKDVSLKELSLAPLLFSIFPKTEVYFSLEKLSFL